jgi:hypothetical protein
VTSCTEAGSPLGTASTAGVLFVFLVSEGAGVCSTLSLQADISNNKTETPTNVMVTFIFFIPYFFEQLILDQQAPDISSQSLLFCPVQVELVLARLVKI